MAKSGKRELTAKQQRFVEEYLVDSNATQAAIRAGYSEKCAEVQGCRLLRYAQVATALRAAKRKISERIQYTIEDHMRELEELHDMAKECKSTMNSAVKAVELKGKVIGAYTEKIEHSGDPKKPVQIIELPNNSRRTED